MITYDYECKNCGNISEHYIIDSNNIPDTIPCPVCNNVAHKVFLKAKSPVIDAPWIRSVLEVVDKDGGQHCQEFLKDPTRDNYKKWMKGEGVRHLEAGEKPGRPTPSPDTATTTDMLMKHRQKKRALCLRK